MSPVDPAHAGEAAVAPESDSQARPAASPAADESDSATPAQAPATVQSLENRYGTGRRSKRDRRFGYAAVGTLLAAGIAFLFFSGWETADQVGWQDIGYTTESELELDVKFEVTAPANTPVACAVEALNTSKATVGWKVIEVPAAPTFTHTVTTPMVVTNPATAVTVRECWVVG